MHWKDLAEVHTPSGWSFFVWCGVTAGRYEIMILNLRSASDPARIGILTPQPICIETSLKNWAFCQAPSPQRGAAVLPTAAGKNSRRHYLITTVYSHAYGDGVPQSIKKQKTNPIPQKRRTDDRPTPFLSWSCDNPYCHSKNVCN